MKLIIHGAAGRMGKYSRKKPCKANAARRWRR